MSTIFPLVAAGQSGSDITVEQDGGAVVRRSILPGGVRVLTERIPGMRSATFGAWVGIGSRDEGDEHLGSTHFLEHLLFKGTDRRSAQDIAEAFDAVGGEANAATGKEHTCYYARVLDKDAPLAIDVILDMVTSATIDSSELELERGVILEELAMHDDDPTDVAFEQFSTAVLGSHPLGRPIGGTPEAIRAVPRDAVWDYYQKHYVPEGLVITAAGGVDHDEICALVEKELDRGGWQRPHATIPLGRRSADSGVVTTAGNAVTVRRTTEQANIIVGGPGLVVTDDDRFTVSVLHAVLGGGMSSRLFQEVRERRGLAYAVQSISSGFADAGIFGLYAGCAPHNARAVVDLLLEEWQALADDGITESELERSIGQLSGGIVLGLEDSSARMSRLGRAELSFGELTSVDESLERVAVVTRDDVQRLAQELFDRPRSIAAVGPFDTDVTLPGSSATVA